MYRTFYPSWITKNVHTWQSLQLQSSIKKPQLHYLPSIIDVFSGPSIFNNNVECILYFLACHVSISHWVPTIFIKRTPMEFLLHKTYLKSCLVLYFPTVNSLSTITISLFRLFASVVVASVFFRHASLRAKYTRLSIRFASLFDQ